MAQAVFGCLQNLMICLLSFLLAWSTVAMRLANPKLKVACVGDSMTAGFPFDSSRGNSSSVSGYPYHLQQRLDGYGYDVKNFGVSGTTVVKSSRSYQDAMYEGQNKFEEALAFQPDILLVMFGANEVKKGRLDKFSSTFEEWEGR